MIILSERYNFFEVESNTGLAVLEANAKQREAVYNKLLDKNLAKEKAVAEERLKIEQDLNKEIAQLRLQKDKEAVKEKEKLLRQYQKEDQKYEQQKEKLQQQSSEIARRFEETQYRSMNIRERQEYQKSLKQRLEDKKKSLAEEINVEKAKVSQLHEQLRGLNPNSSKAKNISKQIAELEASIKEKRGQQKSVNKYIESNAEAIDSLFNMTATSSEKAARAMQEYTAAKEAAAELEKSHLLKQQDLQNALKKAEEDGDKRKIASIKEEIEAEKELYDQEIKFLEEKSSKEKRNEAKKLQAEADAAKKEEEALKKFPQVLTQLIDGAARAVDQSLADIYKDQARMIGRLQGSGTSWTGAVDSVQQTIGFSGAMSQKNLISQMTKLVDSGVAYNLELRAFVAEASDSIASTFDAFDSNLLRLVRLQQQDSTAARLGMEATLTTLLNSFFQDTNYLTSKVSDAVTGALLDTTAILDRNNSLAFEYTVQKWLGSLYSIGMSQEAVTAIAQGINYLGTGNVSALSGNTNLQNLLGMSVARSSGKSYADLLTGTVTADDANKLLRSMVELLSEIASSETNYVTKSAYADLFGMSLTDLRTFSNLTKHEIEQLYNNNVTYDSLINTANSQVGQIGGRKHLSQYIDTVFENITTSVAQNIGETGIGYGVWKALNVIDSVADLEIPGITVLGSGTTSGIKYIDIAKGAYMGLSFLSSVVSGLASGNLFGLPSLSGGSDFVTRGGELNSGGGGGSTSFSAVMGIGSASASDVTATSFESSAQEAQDKGQTSAEEIDASKEIPEKIYNRLGGDSTDTILGTLSNIYNLLDEQFDKKAAPVSVSATVDNSKLEELLDEKRVFYTAIAGVLTPNSVSELTHLETQLSSAAHVESSGRSSGGRSGSFGEPTTSTKSHSSSESDGEIMSLQDVITFAVQNALEQVTSLKVQVTNDWGGMP